MFKWLKALENRYPIWFNMTVAVVLFALLLLLPGCAPTAKQVMLAQEVGTGVKVTAAFDNSYHHSGTLLRVPLSDHQFVESRVGKIDGDNHYSVAYGVESNGDLRFNASLGGSYMDKVPVELTGHPQFLISLGTTLDLGRDWSLLFNARHLSNGSKIFHHGREPNHGVEAAFFGIGFRF